MKKRRKKRGAGWLIAVLTLALIAVAGVIVWRQYEYSASANFYEGLRGAVRGGMRL